MVPGSQEQERGELCQDSTWGERQSLKTAGLTPRSSWGADTPGPSLHPWSAGISGVSGPGADISASPFREACSVVRRSSLSAGSHGTADGASRRSGVEDGGVGAGHGGVVLVVELEQDLVVPLRGTGSGSSETAEPSPRSGRYRARHGRPPHSTLGVRSAGRTAPAPWAPRLAGRAEGARGGWPRRRCLRSRRRSRGGWADGVVGCLGLVCGFE